MKTRHERVLEVYEPRKGGAPVDPNTTKRGFVEAVVDLGDGEAPDPKVLDSLEAFHELRFCAEFVVLPKMRRKGWYAHVIFDVAQFRAVDKVVAFSSNYYTMATSLEEWPTWALGDLGYRAHVFMGVGEAEERLVGPRPA
jgi:hypothetical protein